MHCAHCDHITLFPPPTSQELEDFYTRSDHRGVYSDERWGAWNKEHSYFRQLMMIEKHISPGKMLEVGCAEGVFLSAARERGWQVFGVELSHSLSTIAHEKYDLTTVSTGTIADAGFWDGEFDVVVLSHILEHFHNPYELLDEVVRVLRPGGMAFVAVPHMNNRFIEFVAKLPSKAVQKKLHTLGGSIYPPNHLVVYSLHSLRLALQTVGWQVVDINSKGRTRPLWIGFRDWVLGYLFWVVGSVIGWQPILEVLACNEGANLAKGSNG